MELLSLITKNTHDSSINGLKSNCFCDAIYRLLNYETLLDVAKSLSFMIGSKYIYTGRIVFNKEQNQIEVYYKGGDSSNPIFMIISPEKPTDQLKFNGLSKEIKELLKAEEKQSLPIPEVQPVEVPATQPEAEPVITPAEIIPPKSGIILKVDTVLTNLDIIIQQEQEELKKNSKKEIIEEKTLDAKVEEVITNIDTMVKKEKVDKKVNKLLEGLDKAIEKEKKNNEKELLKKRKSKRIKEIISTIDEIVEKEKK